MGAVHAAAAAPAPRAGAGRKVFRSPGAIAIWYVWLVFAALNLVDLAVRGHDHLSAVIAAVLALITGITFVVALRPRVIADEDAVTLRNPLRDVRVPWGAVTRIDLDEMVRVHCAAGPDGPAGGAAGARPQVLRSWALQSSRRSRMKAQVRGRARAAEVTRQAPGFAQVPNEVRAITAQSMAARAAAELDHMRSGAAERGAPGGPAAVTWSLTSAAAILLPALLLAIVSLLP
jgi:Bacterial PH domain